MRRRILADIYAELYIVSKGAVTVCSAVDDPSSTCSKGWCTQYETKCPAWKAVKDRFCLRPPFAPFRVRCGAVQVTLLLPRCHFVRLVCSSRAGPSSGEQRALLLFQTGHLDTLCVKSLFSRTTPFLEKKVWLEYPLTCFVTRPLNMVNATRE